MNHPDTPSSRRARRGRRDRALDALPERRASTAAFVSRHVAGTYDQIEVVREAVGGFPYTDTERRNAERFLVHLLASSKREDERFVPVPAKLIEREYRDLKWKPLEEDGVILVRSYNRHASRCREFAVADDVRWSFFEAGPTAARVFPDGLYDLVTGNPTTRRIKSDRRTPSGNALPPLIRAAIDSVGDVPVDVHAIERHLARLRAAVDEAGTDVARVTAEGRYLNDLRCYHAVLAQGARPLTPEQPDGLWLYSPAYRPQRFGRLSQKGGGLQSCSSAMKAVAYPQTYP